MTGVWLGADQVREAFKLLANSNVDLAIAFSIILLNIPKILLVTIPVGVLWAAFLVFNRLSTDSELVAMRAGGISLFRIAVPALLFGLLMTGVCYFIGEVVVPWSEPTAQELEFAAAYDIPFRKDIEDFTYFERSGGKRLGQGSLKRIFHVKAFKTAENELDRVTIVDFSRDSVEQIHVARRASWNPVNFAWELHDGVTYVFSADDPSSQSNTATFKTLQIPAGKGTFDLASKLAQIKALSLVGLWELMKDHGQGDIGRGVSSVDTESLNKWTMRFHQKIAYPFSCLSLALIGAPLGVMGRRSRTNWGYVQTGMLVFTYYALQSALNSLGDTARMDPIWASWLPNIILAGIGLFILWRRDR